MAGDSGSKSLGGEGRLDLSRGCLGGRPLLHDLGMGLIWVKAEMAARPPALSAYAAWRAAARSGFLALSFPLQAELIPAEVPLCAVAYRTSCSCVMFNTRPCLTTMDSYHFFLGTQAWRFLPRKRVLFVTH